MKISPELKELIDDAKRKGYESVEDMQIDDFLNISIQWMEDNIHYHTSFQYLLPTLRYCKEEKFLQPKSEADKNRRDVTIRSLIADFHEELNDLLQGKY